MRHRISIRGYVRPLVHPSVSPSVRRSVTPLLISRRWRIELPAWACFFYMPISISYLSMKMRTSASASAHLSTTSVCRASGLFCETKLKKKGLPLHFPPEILVEKISDVTVKLSWSNMRTRAMKQDDESSIDFNDPRAQYTRPFQ